MPRQPREKECPPRWALQAEANGASLDFDDGVYKLSTQQWQLLLKFVVIHTLLGHTVSHDIFNQAGETGPCIPCTTSLGPQHVTEPGWMKGATFSRDGQGRWRVSLPQQAPMYWRLRIARVSKRATRASRHTQGFSHSEDHLQSAQDTRCMSLTHLLCWWAHGPPPSNCSLACRFNCGNPSCLNPWHLCWGSERDARYHCTWHQEKRDGYHPNESAPAKWKPHGWKSISAKGEKKSDKEKKKSNRGPSFA